MNFSAEFLNDPGTFAVNRLPAHSDHRWYPTLEAAEREENPLKLSLNGEWRFAYAENPAAVPEGFEAPDFDCSGWDTIRVPGHLQLQGYDIPQYVNQQYPWEGKQPVEVGEVPAEFNPVGCYVKTFILPEEMTGKRLILCLQGAESCAAVWLNGSFIGYSGNSFAPAEYDLTAALVPGENKLAVRVFKWNCGSWLEDQDMFRLSGLFREVYLYALPEVHLADLKVEAVPDESLTGGLLTVAGRVEGPAGWTAEVLLEGEVLARTPDSLSAAVTVPSVRLWSAESPTLYKLELRLYSPSGALCEVTVQQIGFRKFEIRDGVMQLNGKRIVFCGVNRHDFSADVGRAVTREHIRRDLLTMKRNNINAVRTSHYPDHNALYALCDELGLYVIAENNLETHGTWQFSWNPIADALPGDKPEWKPMLFDRLRSLYEVHKNHPAVLIWSLGNESFGGSVLRDMAAEMHRLDPVRPVHYEGVFNDRRYSAGTTDIESQMYSSAESIRAYLKEHRERPMISCEYSHAMGTSCGALDRYTKLTEEEPLYQGGFIWDFIDQAIAGKTRYGEPALFYGGDLGDRPHDGNFSGDGLCYADGTPTPKMAEVKADYQPMGIMVEKKAVRITNRALFTPTDAYDCTVFLTKNGEPVENRPLQTAIQPGETAEIPLPFHLPAEHGEYAVTASFTLKEDTPWAEKGHEVAFGQGVFTVPGGETASALPAPEIIETPCNIGVRGEGFHILFSRLSGGPVSYVYHGRELFKAIPKPTFWRPVTDNDRGGSIQLRCAQWRLAEEYAAPRAEGDGSWNLPLIPTVERDAEAVTVTFAMTLPTQPRGTCVISYRVEGSGEVECTLSMPAVAGLAPAPALGMQFKMDADFDRLTWYGPGPAETYCDRKNGGRLGIWSGTVREQFAPYLRPQECGNHTDTRWARVTDGSGTGLLFRGDGMDFSALPWTPGEIENAAHPFELPPVHSTVIRCCLKQMGVGGDDSWGSIPHPEYRLPAGEDLRFTFRFRGTD